MEANMLRTILLATTVLLGAYGLAQADSGNVAGSDVGVVAAFGPSGPDSSPDAKGIQSGTGFYLGDGFVVTAAHVLLRQTNDQPLAGAKGQAVAKKGFAADAKKAVAKKVMVVLNRAGYPAEKIAAKIAGLEQVGDFALLKMERIPDGMKTAKLACREPKIGEPIEAVGNPLGIFGVHAWGRVAGVTSNGPPVWPHINAIDLQTPSGFSGGPLYDEQGNVIGIAIGLLRDGSGSVHFMVPALAVCQKIDNPKYITTEQSVKEVAAPTPHEMQEAAPK
jgi:S1-C subfamily serine protease